MDKFIQSLEAICKELLLENTNISGIKFKRIDRVKFLEKPTIDNSELYSGKECTIHINNVSLSGIKEDSPTSSSNIGASFSIGKVTIKYNQGSNSFERIDNTNPIIHHS